MSNSSNPQHLVDEVNAKSKETCAADFERWRNQPMTRFAMSLIPPGQHQEALLTLLQSCFDQGFNAGAGHMMSFIAQRMLKTPSERSAS